MASQRVQRQIDRLLDEAEEALVQGEWNSVLERAQDVLRLGPDNSDATAFLAAAERDPEDTTSTPAVPTGRSADATREPSLPTTIASDRYQVERLLGDGGRSALSRSERSYPLRVEWIVPSPWPLCASVEGPVGEGLTFEGVSKGSDRSGLTSG